MFRTEYLFCRKDSIKLSVCLEDPDVHAGNLIHDALEGIGNGGGYAGMAGGLIKKEQGALLDEGK